MTTPANYLESYANHKLVMVHRADLEEWAKLTAAPMEEEPIDNHVAIEAALKKIEELVAIRLGTLFGEDSKRELRKILTDCQRGKSSPPPAPAEPAGRETCPLCGCHVCDCKPLTEGTLKCDIAIQPPVERKETDHAHEAAKRVYMRGVTHSLQELTDDFQSAITAATAERDNAIKILRNGLATRKLELHGEIGRLTRENCAKDAEIARLQAITAEDDAWRTAINVMVPSAGDGKSCLQRAVEKINELQAKGSK